MPPRLARLLAAVVALALVAGAFVLRGALAGEDDEPRADGRDTPAGGGGGGGDEGSFQVLCDEDLGEAVCTALGEADGVDEVRVVGLGDVLAAATAPAGEAAIDLTAVDAWLTPDPMPALLDEARRGAQLQPLTDERAQVEVTSSRLALLALPETPGGCADQIAVGFGCVIEADANPPVAVPSNATAVGTLAIAAGAVAVHGDTDFGIGAFQGTAESDLLGRFLDDSPSPAGSTTADQTSAMVVQPGAASAAVTLEAIAERQAATVRGQGRELRSVLLGPETTVGVVLAGIGIQGVDAVDALADAVTGQTVADALADAGWDGEAVRSDGLPDSDVIYALREELG